MKSIRLHNMKSFIDSGDIEIKPINIFIGKNSCGKSSLLRFPAVLGQTFLTRTNSPLAFFGQFVDYGSFDMVKHKGKFVENDNGEISFEVGYSICTEEFLNEYIARTVEKEIINKMRDYLGDNFETRLKVTIDKPQKQIKTKSLKIYFNDIMLASFIRNEENDNTFEYTIYFLFNENGVYEKVNTVELEIEDLKYFIPLYDYDEAMGTFEEKIRKENPKASDEEIEEEINIFDNQVNIASEIVRITVDSIYSDAACMSYIGPFREDPKRMYRDTENEVRDVGSKGENLSTILLRESEKENGLISLISEWLEKNYGYKLEISSTFSGFFNVLLVDENGVKSNIMDVGYGISQVLPIVTQLIRSIYVKTRTYVDKHDEIILIEQPELHLHPAAQANLAELIAYSVMKKESQRLMIETHSEHLVRKLQVLVAKKIIGPDMVAIYSVEKDEDGQAMVKKMELNDEGRFTSKWPSGFFDKTHELASELREATSSEV